MESELREIWQNKIPASALEKLITLLEPEKVQEKVSPIDPHVARVKTVYRRALKEGTSWIINRDTFYDFAERLRENIEDNKNEDNPDTVEELLAEAEKKLEIFRHPIPYTIPWEKGGSMWGRNTIPPIECLDAPPMKSAYSAWEDSNPDGSLNWLEDKVDSARDLPMGSDPFKRSPYDAVGPC